jgi:cytochrome c oxidase subunit 2
MGEKLASAAVHYGWWLPPDLSTHGPRIDSIINWMHVFMVVLFVGWGTFLVYTLIKFRARPGHKADYHGIRTHSSTYLETAVAVVEVFFLVGLSIPVWADIKSNPPKPGEADVVVRVVAEQFAWNVHYPGPDGKFGKTDVSAVSGDNPLGLVKSDESAKDDIATINQFHFPVGKKVLVYLTSKDVIHSFNLPVMRVKQDAIPGQTIPVWFEANGTGQFEIACAQLCGLGHYRMKGFFSIDTPEQYDVWLKEQSKAGGFEKAYY